MKALLQDARTLRLLEAALASPAVVREMGGWDTCTVRPLGGGRSAWHVFELAHSGRTRAIIAKVVGRDVGRSECDAYAGPVGKLPPDIRPELLAHVECGDLAVLCLSRVGGAAAQTLTRRLQSADDQAVRNVLARLVPRIEAAWSDCGAGGEIVLRERYATRFFADAGAIAAAEEALNARAAAMFPGEPVPSPSPVLFATGVACTGKARLLHGDFNSDNVICDGEAVFAVDFQCTEAGHVWEDLLSLEASIRINWPADEPPGRAWAAERQLAKGAPGPLPTACADLASEVRRAALDRFAALDGIANLHFATAAIGMRLMLAADLPPAAWPRIVAATVWALRMLRDRSA